MAEQEAETTVVKSTNVDVFDAPLTAAAAFSTDVEDEDGGKQADQVDLSSLSPSEATAREGGWLPKAEFVEAGGDAEDHVSAKVFNDRGELYASVKKTNKEIAYMKRQLVKRDKALKALGEHNQKLGAVEYKKALATLKSQKAEALRSGDYEGVVDIDEAISDVKANEVKEDGIDLDDADTEVSTAVQPPKEWTDYEAENGHWYNSNSIMTAAANNLIVQYIQENGIDGVPTSDEVKSAIAFMDTEIRDAFPHKFTEENGKPNSKPSVTPRKRSNNSAIEAGQGSNTRTNNSAGKSKYTVSDLTDEQRSIAKTFVNSGAMKSVQDYVDQLAEVGGIV